MLAVEVSHLTKRFGAAGTLALRGITLEIPPGVIFGLLGPNGAGKTTLISILAGATTPTEGSVRIFGHDVVRERLAVQQQINMVRGFGGALQKFTVLELMRYYALLYDVPRPKERIERILHRVGLWERRHGAVSDFSSGWRQRFFLAKALINDPKLLLLDEPTVGLDVDAAIHVRDLIAQLRGEGCTILLTTHYMQEAEALCDAIALIANGRIVAQGTANELKAIVRGNGIVEISGAVSPSAAAALRKLPGKPRIASSATGTRVVFSTKDVPLPKILAILGRSASGVRAVSVHEPTLEDVFLTLTKRRLDDE
jgi:ABC-2 type transport system ATP-binding protein